jgi:hypothetical protein
LLPVLSRSKRVIQFWSEVRKEGKTETFFPGKMGLVLNIGNNIFWAHRINNVMNKDKKTLTYKREKGKIEISGDQKAVEGPMWFDLICTWMLYLGTVAILLVIMPKASFLPGLWKAINRMLSFLILFAVVGEFVRMLLSG